MFKKFTTDEVNLFLTKPDSVLAVLNNLVKTVNHLEKQVKQLAQRNHLLEDSKSLNSSNSSIPPSADGFRRQHKTKSLRKKSNRKQGGQKGHKGSTLQMADNPDKVKILKLHKCPNCSKSLKNSPALDLDKRQVYDIPQIKVEVTEYQAEIKKCPQCNHISKADFPKGITHKTQYGSQIKTTATYLNQFQLIPLERTARLFEDLFGHRISTATIIRFNKECSGNLKPFIKKLKQILTDGKLLNVDETSLIIDGIIHWLHVASNSSYTLYHSHRNRGKIAIDNFGILPLFNGTAVHDHLPAYKEYSCMHAFCNAHHLRELTFSYEQYQQKWALEMIKLLTRIKRTVDKAALNKQDKLDKLTIRNFEQQYEKLIKQGLEEVSEIENKIKQPRRPGPRKQSKPKNLLDRLNTFKNEVLRFMKDFQIPFDNNQAERDLRMMKLQQKISGSFRSKTGPEYFTNIRSYISTALKQNLNIRTVLLQAFDGNPFIPQVTAE